MIMVAVFTWAVLLTSIAVFVMVGGLTRLSLHLRQSSLVWAAAMLAVVLIAGFATWWYFVPSQSPSQDLLAFTEAPLLAVVGSFDWQIANSNATATASHQPLFITTWTVVYLAGLALCLMRLGLGRLRAARIANQAVQDMTTQVKNVWLTEELISPCVLRAGWRGDYRIVLPRTLIPALTESELNMVIAHEKAHIQRHDDQVGMLLRLIVSLTWFTPFMHRLLAEWAEAIELQCDQAVVAAQPRSQRRDYVQTLLKTMRFTQNENLPLPVAAFATTSLRREKMRICLALGDRPYRALGRVTKGLILVGTLACSTIGGMALSSGMLKESSPLSVDTPISQPVAMLHKGRHTSGFGMAKHPFKPGQKRNHTGVDIAAPVGTVIHAPADGVIVTATDLYNGLPKYGKVVVLETNGDTQTLLAHLDQYMVTAGQRVTAGEPIATIGNTGQTTGPHVHIETRLRGERVDPHSVWQLPQPN